CASTHTSSPQLYTLSLHDALPISLRHHVVISKDSPDSPDCGTISWMTLLADTHWIVDQAKTLGFDLCGVVRAEKFPELEQMSERSEEHTSELQSRVDLVCRLLLEK